jgi:hypothetical protein
MTAIGAHGSVSMSGPRPAGTATRWLGIKLRFLRGLPDWNEHSILLWAAGAGAAGALATILFRETIHLVQLLFTQQQGGLVSAAMALPLWQRVLVPTKQRDEMPRRPLAEHRVLELLKKDRPSISPDASLEAIAETFGVHRVQYLYVADSARRFLGAVSLHEVAQRLQGPRLMGAASKTDLLFLMQDTLQN